MPSPVNLSTRPKLKPKRTRKEPAPGPLTAEVAAQPFEPAVDQKQFSFLFAEDFVEKHNIAWRVALATDDAANPLLEPEFPWESAAVFSHGTVAHRSDRWQMESVVYLGQADQAPVFCGTEAVLCRV